MNMKDGNKYVVTNTDGSHFKYGDVVMLIEHYFNDTYEFIDADGLQQILRKDSVRCVTPQPEQPKVSHLTNEELCRQYRFDDNALIREFAERLSDMEDLQEELDLLEDENARSENIISELENE